MKQRMIAAMASISLYIPHLSPLSTKCKAPSPRNFRLTVPVPKSAASIDAGNAALESPHTTRPPRTRNKSPSPWPKPIRFRKKPDPKPDPEQETDQDLDSDDEIDFAYESPPLVRCFGAAKREFVPTVRVSGSQAHPDQESTWKELLWAPPEFVRTPRGPPEFGNDLVYRMNTEKARTREVKIDPGVKTAASRMRIEFREEEGGGGKKRMVSETVKECAEDSLSRSEIDIAVLK